MSFLGHELVQIYSKRHHGLIFKQVPIHADVKCQCKKAWAKLTVDEKNAAANTGINI